MDTEPQQPMNWIEANERRLGERRKSTYQPGYLNSVGKQFNARSGSNVNSVDGIARAQEELDEAREEAAAHSPSPEFVEECADVVITLASVCAGLGLDLDAAVRMKHAKNMARQWGPHPTIPGGVKHIKPKKTGWEHPVFTKENK